MVSGSIAKSCKAIINENPDSISEFYTIQPSSDLESVEVYCDMEDQLTIYNSCTQIKKFDLMAESGIYKIKPDENTEPYNVYCDMETEGTRTFPAVTPLSFSENLVAYYDFEGDNSYNDKSGNNNHGTNYGSTIIDGIKEKSASFDGVNDYIDIGVQVDNNFSYSFFSRFNDISSTQALIAQRSKTNILPLIDIQVENYMLQFQMRDNNGAGHTGPYISLDNSFINTNNFYTFTKNGTQLNIYVNGELKKQTTYSGGPWNIADSVYIGKDPNDNIRLFNGLIDDVAIFDRALTGTEIKKLYQGYTYDYSQVKSSCLEHYNNGANISGIYKINPTGVEEFEVYCDMEADGGGWTLIAKINTAEQYGMNEPRTWFNNQYNTNLMLYPNMFKNAGFASLGASRFSDIINTNTLAKFELIAEDDYAQRAYWYKKVNSGTNLQSWFQTSNNAATLTCSNLDMTENCSNAEIIKDVSYNYTIFQGMNLSHYNYATAEILHLRLNDDNYSIHSGVCSASDNYNNNAWHDDFSGHWGNGMLIWIR